MKTMKWLLAGLLIAAPSLVRAAQDDNFLPVTLTVNEAFGVTVTGSTDLGAADAGTTAPQTLALSVTTNHALPWSLLISATPLTHADTVTTIPAASYRYFQGGGAGTGTYTPAVFSDAEVPTAPTSFYDSALGEESVSAFGFGIDIYVPIPPAQKTGDYTSTLTISLMDAF